VSATRTVMSVTRVFVLALRRAACAQSTAAGQSFGSWPGALHVRDCSTGRLAAKKNDRRS
jgi:hypothetical protein